MALGVMALGIDAARAIAGALLIDKPSGPTSHDIVAFVRRTLKVERAGHTGTLDPLATGLLVVLVGSATRLAQFLAADEKEYVAEVRLGVATPTYDAASLSDARGPRTEVRGPNDAEIAEVLERFHGTFRQTPPPFSAKKIASVPAYEKARKNQPVDLQPVEVTVRELELLSTANLEPRTANLELGTSVLGPRTSDLGVLRLRVAASAGFYVRSLAHDIGQALGCGAHLETLRRTRVGRFRVDDALTLDRVEFEGAARLTSPNDLLGHMPAVTVTEDGARRVAHGNPVTGNQTPGAGHVRLVDGAGILLAVAERRPGGLLQPVVVLR
jgi:tRNA pseudouridine55 synthase